MITKHFDSLVNSVDGGFYMMPVGIRIMFRKSVSCCKRETAPVLSETIRILTGMSGGAIRVSSAYTSQTCSLCLHVAEDSRCGRLFRCISCGFIHHTDINAGCNIENRGRKKLGLPRLFIKSLHTLPDYIGTASGIGQQDVEGGFTTDRMVSRTTSRTVSRVVSGGHSVKRQTWTEVKDVVSERARVVRLWDDV